MSATNNKLHWSQRVALVRHNLHAASRSGDFLFFKTLQANAFMEGSNHAATLSEELGDEADIVLASFDNLNAGLAYLHQDAFKNVYESLKNEAREDEGKVDKSKLYVDITLQKYMADMAIEKTTSSALALIKQQPAIAQEAAANVWITGVTVIADCIEVALQQMNELDGKMDDYIRLEDSWDTVKASILESVTVLKGVFHLMDPSTPQESRSNRSSSIVSASGSVFRRLSTALAGGPSNGSRNSSIASAPATQGGNNGRNLSVSSTDMVYRTPNYVRNSISSGCPTTMPAADGTRGRKLSVIPPTPKATTDEERDPFDTSAPPMPDIPVLPPMPLPTFNKAGTRVSLAAF